MCPLLNGKVSLGHGDRQEVQYEICLDKNLTASRPDDLSIDMFCHRNVPQQCRDALVHCPTPWMNPQT